MLPGVNPRQMQQMMKKMGVSQVDIPATQVIIKTAEKDLVINNPTVQRVKMMGQETLQITGAIEEHETETTPDINEDDVQTVVDQTGADKETARKAIEEHNGDLAEAILSLKE